jgi:hypothetical protein
MKILSIVLVALFALSGVASLVPIASAGPTCQASTLAVGTLEIATVRSGPECGAYAVTVCECTPKYGEAAPLHFECTTLLNA